MKAVKLHIFPLVAAFLLCTTFFSCSPSDHKEEEGNGVFSIDVRIENSLSGKATTGANFRTEFDDGDEIGLYVVRRVYDYIQVYPGNTAYVLVNNVKFTYDKAANKWNPPPGFEYKFSQGQILDIYAYYPYAQNLAPNYISINANQGALDRMMAIVTAYPAMQMPVPLEFKHILCLIQVTIPDPERYTSRNVWMTNIYPTGYYNMNTPSGILVLNQPSNGQGVVPMDEVRTGVFQQFIINQEVYGGTPLFFIECDDDVYNYHIYAEEDTQFKTGHYYDYQPVFIP